MLNIWWCNCTFWGCCLNSAHIYNLLWKQFDKWIYQACPLASNINKYFLCLLAISEKLCYILELGNWSKGKLRKHQTSLVKHNASNSNIQISFKNQLRRKGITNKPICKWQPKSSVWSCYLRNSYQSHHIRFGQFSLYPKHN